MVTLSIKNGEELLAWPAYLKHYHRLFHETIEIGEIWAKKNMVSLALLAD